MEHQGKAVEIRANVAFGRQFRLWAFSVGHSQLLLRSLKSESHPTRVDVVFASTSVVCIPGTIDNLSIEPVADGPLPEAIERIIHSQPQYTRTVYELRGDGFTGYVVAGAVEYLEDEGEFDDPSGLFHAYGTVLPNLPGL